jgi:hypothetical protein
VCKDDYVSWFTLVAFLDDTRVIVFHSYFDDPFSNELSICEALIQDGTCHVQSFVGICNDSQLTADYLLQNEIPFGFMQETIGKKLVVSVRQTSHIAIPPVGDWRDIEDAFRMM